MTSSMKMSRRTVLRGAAAIGATTLAAPLLAQGLKKVKFANSWLPEGSNLPAYVALGKGYWEARGYDVEITPRVSGEQISTGEFDIGFLNGSTLPVQRARGVDLIAIGQMDYKTTMGVGLLASSPIASPAELAGHSLGSSPRSSEYPFLPAYAKAAGLDLSQVEQVQLDSQVRETALLQGTVDAITGVGSSILSKLLPQGEKVKFMLYNDAGLDQLMGQTMVVTPAMLDKDPEMVAAIVDGMMEAIKFAALNTEEAIETFLGQVPEMALNAVAKEQLALSLGITQTMNLVPEVQENGIGFMSADKYVGMWNLAQEYVIKEGTPAPAADKLMVNDFVGKQTYTPAEWEALNARLETYKSLFAV
ncbi:ABC transporter substrate-binding protein [Maritimibacter alkaliphilus]|uniref:ABC transporter substrate-binding protein n=1 Tax=Maritimibacter alkaliphilus TaxID=404236 RepID=UPI001C967886|nr:ABC transporter substrate-binding protein [Maritimibacter alkaliphilus]MBY6092858.1 ABC transporter substrate-binding protein [Maritimibacter alkaliphilus]